MKNAKLKFKNITKYNLKPFGEIIQICPECGKVDAYKNDGHDCIAYIQAQKSNEYYD